MTSKPTLLFVYGTRPEAIKVIPVVKYFSNFSQNFNIISCNTGQHKEMVAQVEEYFDHQPDYSLDVMKHNQTLPELSSNLLTALEIIFKANHPRLVFVQGDTTTAFISGLTAFYNKIRVAHIEAGLRSYDKYSPWPEEMNRKMLTALADFNFAPTELSKENLLKERVNAKSIFVTGNTGIDSLKYLLKKVALSSELSNSVQAKFFKHGINLDEIRSGRKVVLITVHRRENFGGNLTTICTSIKEMATKYPELLFIWPVHLNPNIRTDVMSQLQGDVDNIKLTEPLAYLEFISLMSLCFLIFTDSGGIQEEAPSLGKRVVVLREKTERPEGLASEFVRMAGESYSNIVNFLDQAISGKWTLTKEYEDIYGHGDASKRIFQIVQESEIL